MCGNQIINVKAGFWFCDKQVGLLRVIKVMASENLTGVVEVIRKCFQTRDFTPMVGLFASDGVYETPYAEGNNRQEGIDAIRKRFEQVVNSPWNNAVKIEEVMVNSIPSNDGVTVTVEFRITGTRLKDQVTFDIRSSIAVIKVTNGRIAFYRDYPNVAGIRKAAGFEN